MKILHIAPSYYPAFKYGGTIEAVYLLNKTLVKKGIEVDVFTTNIGLENKSDITLNKWHNIDGVRVKYFSAHFYEHYTFSPRLFWRVLSDVKKYDLVHITAVWNFPVLAGSLASLINNKPYIISPHGVLYNEAINLKSRRFKKSYFYLFAMHYLKRASAVHYTSDDERNRIADFINLDNKSFVIPNGIDLTQYNQLPKPGNFKMKYPVLHGKRYILFLSRIDKRKGLDILINAFHKLAALDRDLYLVIAGPDSSGYSEVIKKQLDSFGLLSKTIFTGLLTGVDKLSAYVDAEAFILLSNFENFGIVVIEAMACKTPIIISRGIGISGDIEKNKAGLIVENNPDLVFDSFKSLITNKILREQIILNGRRLIEENYNINIVADQMITAYEKILQS